MGQMIGPVFFHHANARYAFEVVPCTRMTSRQVGHTVMVARGGGWLWQKEWTMGMSAGRAGEMTHVILQPVGGFLDSIRRDIRFGMYAFDGKAKT